MAQKIKIPLKTTPINVNTIEREIDYFKIPVEIFARNGYEARKQIIPLANDEWLSVENHLSNIDHNKKEAVVFNIQVGKGKTTACYKLFEYSGAK